MAVPGLPAKLVQRPLRVLRPQDASPVYAHPRPEIARLARAGVLHPLARGFYAVVPPDRAGDRTWRPSLEAAAVGIAAAQHNADEVVLMHLSAARVYGAVPRALGVAVVAVPRQRPSLRLADRDAHVVFVERDTARLDAERVGTDLGPALVTTVEQTVLDLARRPALGGVEEEAWSAVRALLSRTDHDVLWRLAGEQRLRAPLRRAQTRVGPERPTPSRVGHSPTPAAAAHAVAYAAGGPP